MGKSTRSKPKKGKDLSYLITENLSTNQKEKLNKIKEIAEQNYVEDESVEEYNSKFEKTIKTNLEEINSNNNLFSDLDFKNFNSMEDTAIMTLITKLNEIPKNKEFIQRLRDLKTQFRSRRKRIEKYLLELEGALNDIHHIMENVRASASEGFIYYKCEHELAVKRRDIKYEITEINVMLMLLTIIIKVLDDSKVPYNPPRSFDSYHFRILDKNKDILKQVETLVDFK